MKEISFGKGIPCKWAERQGTPVLGGEGQGISLPFRGRVLGPVLQKQSLKQACRWLIDDVLPGSEGVETEQGKKSGKDVNSEQV